MSAYIQLLFENISTQQSEILIAELDAAGYEGFEEGEGNLKAFITKEKFDSGPLTGIAGTLGISYSKSFIEETNWNELWESNFQPVVIDQFAGIRASFHDPLKGVEHEIIITPKMSFGTGHHATTYLMVAQMKNIDFRNKSVLDFGTGTGILAILAAKLGASVIVAIDNDEWSIMNTRENILQNNVTGIEVLKADSADIGSRFDIILANINKNIILENFGFFAKQLAKNGVLLLSGLLSEDEGDILARAQQSGLKLQFKVERHNWLCLRLSY